MTSLCYIQCSTLLLDVTEIWWHHFGQGIKQLGEILKTEFYKIIENQWTVWREKKNSITVLTMFQNNPFIHPKLMIPLFDKNMWSALMYQQIVSASNPVIVIKYWPHTMHLYANLLICWFFKVKNHYAPIIWEEMLMERRLAFPGSHSLQRAGILIWCLEVLLTPAQSRSKGQWKEQEIGWDEVFSEIGQWGIFFNEQDLIGAPPLNTQ